jgi:hypothetical protein
MRRITTQPTTNLLLNPDLAAAAQAISELHERIIAASNRSFAMTLLDASQEIATCSTSYIC